MASMMAQFPGRPAVPKGAAASSPWPGGGGAARGTAIAGNTQKRELRTDLRAFTLIELLTVIAIIALIAAMSVPAIRSMGKSNDISQSANLVRSMISTARGIAMSQHRMAGVVFFEETAASARPVHAGQTAMQLFVEMFDQTDAGIPLGGVKCVYFNTARQYLPSGVRAASLSDLTGGGNIEAGDAGGARAIIFGPNGELVLRAKLWTRFNATGKPGSYDETLGAAYADWKFDGTLTARSFPGFFLYNAAEYNAQSTANRPIWLKKNSSVVIVNGNTGGVLR